MVGIQFTINRVFEKNDVLRVEVESPYGVDNFGLGIHQKYLDPVTQQPKYLKEIKELLLKKYQPDSAAETDVTDGNAGQSFDTDTL